MARIRRIGILTGGGDVPGLNSVIKSVVYRSTELGFEVLGIRRGWEGLTHQRPGAELDPDYVLPARSDQHADHRPHRRHGPAHVAHEPAQDARRPAARAPVARARGDDDRRRDDLRPDAGRAREHRATRARLPRAHRWRRHAELRADAARPGRAAHRHPQDDGQRRPGHRVLHRLLLGHHARQGGHQPPAHDARLARADRRLPHLRARLRLQRALYGLRHVGALPDPGGAVRPRAADRRSWPRTTATTRAAMPSSSPPRAPSGRVEPSRKSARPTPSAIATRPTSPRSSRPRSRRARRSRPSSPS